MPRSRIVAICVNYCSECETLAFVRALIRDSSEQTAVSIVITDNSPSPSEHLSDIAAMNRERVAYDHFGRNIGYLNALDEGVRIARTKWPDAGWYVISNTDVEYDPKNFATVLSAIDTEKYEIGVVAPSITSTESGRAQNPFAINRPTRVRMLIRLWIYQFAFTSILYTAAHRIRRNLFNTEVADLDSESWEQRPAEVKATIYAAHGACMAISRKFYTVVGNLTSELFLYGEELYIAETAREAGFLTLYIPSLRAVHREHATTALIPNRDRRILHSRSLKFLISRFWSS